MPTNQAAWLVAEKQHPLVVQPAPYTAPSEGEIVVRVRAVAFNPVDGGRQVMGKTLFDWVTYPAILGADLAGEIVEVGPGVDQQYQPGDRVLAMSLGLEHNRADEAAFQLYAIVQQTLIAKIPSNISFEGAATIPLGLGTAACGLFMKDYLALDFPTAPARPQNGKTLFIWGGSTSVGTNAIQLAVAAGYEVVTTASSKNHEYLKKIGASQTFDYHSETVVADVVQALKGKNNVGALAIGIEVNEQTIEIIEKVDGVKFVACANRLRAPVPDGIGAKFIWGSDLCKNEVGPAIFKDFIPQALADGTLIPSPPMEVVGTGLEFVQEAIDRLRAGVSLKKIVVSL